MKIEIKIDELSPLEVADRLQREDGAVYLDVRTEEEFFRGRPAGALNIPIVIRDPRSGLPFPNFDFVSVVEAHVPKEAPVYVGCATGRRSLHVAGIMKNHGYRRVANVGSGYSGKKDAVGRLTEPGWLHLDLPTDFGDPGDLAYRMLLACVEAG